MVQVGDAVWGRRDMALWEEGAGKLLHITTFHDFKKGFPFLVATLVHRSRAAAERGIEVMKWKRACPLRLVRTRCVFSCHTRWWNHSVGWGIYNLLTPDKTLSMVRTHRHSLRYTVDWQPATVSRNSDQNIPVLKQHRGLRLWGRSFLFFFFVFSCRFHGWHYLETWVSNFSFTDITAEPQNSIEFQKTSN